VPDAAPQPISHIPSQAAAPQSTPHATEPAAAPQSLVEQTVIFCIDASQLAAFKAACDLFDNPPLMPPPLEPYVLTSGSSPSAPVFSAVGVLTTLDAICERVSILFQQAQLQLQILELQLRLQPPDRGAPSSVSPSPSASPAVSSSTAVSSAPTPDPVLPQPPAASLPPTRHDVPAVPAVPPSDSDSDPDSDFRSSLAP